VIVHYRHSKQDAQKLIDALNHRRNNSAIAIHADLNQQNAYEKLIQDSIARWNRLDVLINNASTFAPTPVGNITENDWHDLLNSNLKAPLFLSQAAANALRESRGNIINITDIHAKTPMKNYSVYSCAKAGLRMLTRSLAVELAPTIRVNAIAPGNVLWPEGKNNYSEEKKQAILSATLLQKQVDLNDIAKAALFLAEHHSITGQTIAVDAGRLV